MRGWPESGALFHATSHRKYFEDYVQGDFEFVLWVMIKHVKLLGKARYYDKVVKWKPMDAKSCKAYFKFENKYDIIRTVGW